MKAQFVEVLYVAINMEESIQKVITENPDSITIGSATKGAQLKVYGNFDDLEKFKSKVDNARAVRDYANKILGNEFPLQ